MKISSLKLVLSVVLLCFLTVGQISGQDKLKKMPGYERYTEIAPQVRRSIKMAPTRVSWNDDSKSFDYRLDGKNFTYSLNKKKSETSNAKSNSSGNSRFRRSRVARGRQAASAESPNGKYKAFTKNRNMYLSDSDGTNVLPITEDGNEDNQVKYGIATWVYGEELRQTTAMWWSPDSKKVAFYKFQEKEAKKYYVVYNQTKIQDSVEIEAYPKVGAKNLPVDLMVYDLETKKTTLLDTRDGKEFSDGPMGTYLYNIAWSPDGKELLYHSTNRKQNTMDYRAANPNSGKSRTIVREQWLPSFTVNSPEIEWLDDGKRFIWASERTGFKNYYLYHINGELLNPITQHNYEVANLVKVDENSGYMFYMARSGNNHMKMQLHKVRLNGKGDQRLTDPNLNHNVSLSPNNQYFVDAAQTHNTPVVTSLKSTKGKHIAVIAKSDMTEYKKLGLKPVEVFTFTSADGVTQLHGMLHFPSNFDPSKKYPVILSNYGGPATNAFRENFTMPHRLTEFGFLVLNIDGRNVRGRGKKLLDQLYGNLGIVEMDDFAEGVKSLYDRPYFDKLNVGVYGTSYGGTTAATSLLRFPKIYRAAVANSAVTDWRNYDNIYTERFMNTIEDNKAGYDAGSLMQYADKLEGELMIFFGTNDNNVHPANSLQLIQALQKAGKSFEVQIGPDKGHTAMNTDRMMEFFIEHLVLNKAFEKLDLGTPMKN